MQFQLQGLGQRQHRFFVLKPSSLVTIVLSGTSLCFAGVLLDVFRLGIMVERTLELLNTLHNGSILKLPLALVFVTLAFYLNGSKSKRITRAPKIYQGQIRWEISGTEDK
jgi:hypothetical protein